MKNTGYPNFELIIVDNGSHSDLVEYLEKFADLHPNVRLVLNDSNLGFAKANNHGAQMAQGDYLVLLNNDTIVTPGWLHKLLGHLQKNPDAAMVGPVTNAISNQAKIHINYTGFDINQINAFAAQRAIDYAKRGRPEGTHGR